jgi:asparagine synthase (glutamine-hydrolysing)
MCGIFGSIGCLYSITKVLALEKHRGPDGQGYNIIPYRDKQTIIGHTRLSILDTSSAGNQPMQSKDKRWWITFNGEIYNHLTLREKISCVFNGHSDTETLIELISHQGIEKTLPQLNGMFAFAALDVQEGKLYLVRDPFGIKPLYYTQKGTKFAFASEMRAIQAMEIGERSVDEVGLQSFLTLRYIPSPTTIWQGIKRLSPGHFLCLCLKKQEKSLNCYVAPSREQFDGDFQDAVMYYQKQLYEAVKRQLLSDVSVGMLLSGGIDSALIAAMAQDAGYTLPCYSVGFGANHTECELNNARETARILDLPFEPVTVTPELLRDALPEIVKSVEEPLGTTSIMPMWYLVRQAQKDVSVVLTGQGADEPWGGYRKYQVEIIRKRFPYPAFWRTVGSCGQFVSKYLPEDVERGLRTLAVEDPVQSILEACSLFSTQQRRLLTNVEDINNVSQSMGFWYKWLGQSNCTPVERMMSLDMRMNLADDLLLYGDKISMSTSLESRVPMLDIELVNFIESLPPAWKIQLGKGKIIHKLMAKQYLPSSIIQRPKIGFKVPFGEWSRGVWKSFIEDILFAENAPHWAVLNRKYVFILWTEHLNQAPDRTRQIFSLFILAIWWKEVETKRFTD